MFGKLFGRGKAKRDAFGVETATVTTAVPGTETTVVTTTSETRSLGLMDLFGSPSTGDLDLGGLLATVQQAQAEAGGDHEAMAKLLQERLGGEASVVVDQQSSVDWSAVPAQQQDPIALLATLSELHDKGIVSDEQFEAQKRRLLGDA